MIEVVYREGSGYRKSNMGNPESRFLSKTTHAKSKHPFFQKGKSYVFSLIPNGFKLKVAGIDDKNLRKANRQGSVCVGGVEPGIYEIVDETNDFIIAKKQKA